MKRGINISLGTDGPGSTNTLDMFEEMRVCNLLQKVNNLSSSCINAYDAIQFATIGGAKVLGLDKQIGAIEVGKKADIIIVDTKGAHLNPINDVFSNLVYSTNGADVITTIVNGKILMENRKINFVDEEDIINKCNKIAKRIFNKN